MDDLAESVRDCILQCRQVYGVIDIKVELRHWFTQGFVMITVLWGPERTAVDLEPIKTAVSDVFSNVNIEVSSVEMTIYEHQFLNNVTDTTMIIRD